MTELVRVDNIENREVRVVFAERFPVAQRAGTTSVTSFEDVFVDVEDIAGIDDAGLKTRMEEILDIPRGSLSEMMVQRPEGGHFIIMSKPRFGLYSIARRE